RTRRDLGCPPGRPRCLAADEAWRLGRRRRHQAIGEARRLVRTAERVDLDTRHPAQRSSTRRPLRPAPRGGVRFGHRRAARMQRAPRRVRQRPYRHRQLGEWGSPMTVTKPQAAPASGRLGDPITFELIRNALFFLVNEMALTLVRASYSGILRE